MHTDIPTDPPLMESATPSLPGTRAGGFWVRAAALVIDSGVIAVGSLIIALVVAVIGVVTQLPTAATLGGLLVTNLGAIVYLAAMESSPHQATLGKRAFGLTVTDLAGRRLSFGRALGRACAKYLNTLALGLGWILAGVTSRKRGLHDFVVGTVVAQKAGPHPLGWIATAAVICVLSVPLAGVVAAIAIPGLIRARMSGNEAKAIGALRAIRAAQQHYRQDCGGYAMSLTSLGAPKRYLMEELTFADTVNQSGYGIGMTSSPGSDVRDTSEGCRNTVSAFTAQAAPAAPGVTGTRFFVLAEDGVIYHAQGADFLDRQPIE